jgi:transketolase
MVKGDAKPILKPFESIEIERITTVIEEARKDLLVMYNHEKHIHLESSLSSLEIIATLLLRYIKRSADPINRDWLILSKGHAAPALYAVLAELGIIPKSELVKINSINSVLQNHPEVAVPGVDIATGSLAQGLSIGVGIAAWIKRVGGGGRVYVIIGDGEQDEGQVWEAITHAAALRLDNLIVVVDWNGHQLDGSVKDIKPKDYIPFVWKAIGWKVLWANGHNITSLIIAVEEALESDKPTVIFAQTTRRGRVSASNNDVS